MPYWIITAPNPPEGCTPREAYEHRVKGGRMLLKAAARLLEEGGVVLDQFLYPYVDRVILDGGGCLKGVISLGDRMLVEVPEKQSPDFLGTETGVQVHIVEKRPPFSSFFAGDEPFSKEKDGQPISSGSGPDEPMICVSWQGVLPDGWKDYEVRRFCKRWNAFTEMAERPLKAGGGGMVLAEGRMLLFSLPEAIQQDKAVAQQAVKEKLTGTYLSQMDALFPQGAPPLLWREGVPAFGEENS